jgi:exosortase
MKSSSSTSAGATRAQRVEAALLVLGIGLLLALVYAPFLSFLFRDSVSKAQLNMGGLLVLFTMAVALRDTLRRERLRPQLSQQGAALLIAGAFLLILAGRLRGLALPLVTLSFCASFAAVVSFLFGEVGVRRFVPAFAGLAAFGLLVGLFPALDWPLRAVAARYSAGLLMQLGVPVHLDLVPQHPPQLLIEIRQRVFSVATECNGFGLLTSSILLAVVLGFHYPMSAVRRVGLVAFAALVALVFNFLRIVAICLVAVNTALPYPLIHEGVGTLIYLAGLALIWWVV